MSIWDPKLLDYFHEQGQAQTVSDLQRRLAQAERNAGLALGTAYSDLSGDITDVANYATMLNTVKLGTDKVKWGFSAVTWPGGSPSVVFSISHGLGVTPSTFLAMALSQSGTGPISTMTASPPTASAASVQLNTVPIDNTGPYLPPGTSTTPVAWVAVA